MNKICYGCGVKLQSKDSTLPGFIPLGKEDSPYCQRCFKLIHYGINQETMMPKSTDNLINLINKENKLVLFLVSFFTIREDVIEVFKKITTPKILVISKIDNLPPSLNIKKLKSYIKTYYKIEEDICFISSVNELGIKSLLSNLKSKDINDIVIAGESNSGKSTFINKILSILGSKLNMLTTSKMPNTTMDFIRLKVNSDLNIIDTPGFILETVSFLNAQPLKGRLKPVSFQMKEGEVLKINNMFLKFQNNSNITLYFERDVYAKKYYKDVFLENSIDIKDNTDLIIKGLGFIRVKNGTLVMTHNLEEKDVELRDSVFGGFYEQD